MSGYRGYVTSRPFLGNRVPQHVQNIVIREYCNRLNIVYLLSGTEYAIPESYFILNSILENLEMLDGVVAYSLFQMPLDSSIRKRVFKEIVDKNKTLHFAVEGITISSSSDIQLVEDVLSISMVINSQLNVQELI
jgi:sporadic carbohydrate cluster protein (TIGR04323 family)